MYESLDVWTYTADVGGLTVWLQQNGASPGLIKATVRQISLIRQHYLICQSGASIEKRMQICPLLLTESPPEGEFMSLTRLSATSSLLQLKLMFFLQHEPCLIRIIVCGVMPS